MANKNQHRTTDGDAVLAAAKEKRAKEIEEIRAAEVNSDEIIPESWVKRDTSFPPYLQMYVGATFRVRPIWRDERQIIETRQGDRPFVRYHLELKAPKAVECRRGPTDERGTPVAVYTDQVFSIGAFAGLEQELNALMGLEVAIQCVSERPLKDDPETGMPRKFFEFETYVSPDTARMLKSESVEDQAKLRDAYRAARQAARANNMRLLVGAPVPTPLEQELRNGAPRQAVAVPAS